MLRQFTSAIQYGHFTHLVRRISGCIDWPIILSHVGDCDQIGTIDAVLRQEPVEPGMRRCARFTTFTERSRCSVQIEVKHFTPRCNNVTFALRDSLGAGYQI